MFKKLIAIVLLLIPAASYAAPLAFEDVNCDGFFDPAIDNPILPGVPGNPPADLFIDSPYCLVIPKGSISAKAWNDVFVNAEGDVTIGATLTTTTGPDSFGGAWVKGGMLNVLPGTRITSAGGLYVGSNTGPLLLGDSTAFTSTKSYADVIAYNDDVLVGRGVVIEGLDQAALVSDGGRLNAGLGGLKVTAGKFGSVDLFGREGLTIVGATIKGYGVNIETPAMPLVFKSSRITFTVPAEGFGNVSSHDFNQPCCVLGPVDVTGSQLPSGGGEVFIDGNPIVGH